LDARPGARVARAGPEVEDLPPVSPRRGRAGRSRSARRARGAPLAGGESRPQDRTPTGPDGHRRSTGV